MLVSIFLDKLDGASEVNHSLVCVGLDPIISLIPSGDVFEFNKCIIEATKGHVCAYKPNLAFYEALGNPGLKALENTIEYIRESASGILVIGDAKRGDIEHSSVAYARAMFVRWGFDAVTVNAYAGVEAVRPFLDYEDRGVIVLCRTSNPGSDVFQELNVQRDGKSMPLYECVARQVVEWNANKNLALVVGANYHRQLANIRAICGDMPILIPGVGSQGGELKSAVMSGINKRGRRIMINSSRSILYASQESDFADKAEGAAKRLKDSINLLLQKRGLGWDK